jgi:hypothetical protein
MFKINLFDNTLRIRVIMLSSAITLSSALTAWSDDYNLGIKAGVSREFLDFEDDKNNLILRGGTSINISQTFGFNYTAIQNLDKETFSYTWNLQVNRISDFINFTAGNYNLHFGSGLMMGRKSYSSPDPFSKKISIAKEQTISPSNSGNPQYSLYGTVFEFYKTFEDVKVYFIPFFSLQRRFISYQSLESGAIDSSLFSLNSKIEKSGNNTEPVNIINYGGVCGFQTLSLFNLQLYYFETDLKGDSGEDILWDKNKHYSGDGVDLIKNGGFFGEYADRNISLFIEPSFSSITGSGKVTDYAVAWGIGIQNHLMNFSIKGKNCGDNFHSEYSSGSRTPERIWELKCGVSPHEIFKTGFIIYTEKDLVPGYNKKYIEGSIEEEIFAALNFRKVDIDMNLKRREHYSSDRDNPIDQGNLSAAISASDRVYLKIRSSAQKKEDYISGLAGGEMKYLFSGYMSLSLGYTRIIINGENPFYAMITPASEHSSITRFTESAHGGSVNLKYKRDKNSFYIRLTITQKDSGREGDAESALALLF